MDDFEERISSILYYKIDKTEYWLYSEIISDNEYGVNKVYSYSLLSYDGKNTYLENVKNPLNILENLKVKPREIVNNADEFIRFYAIKNVHEQNVMDRIKQYLK